MASRRIIARKRRSTTVWPHPVHRLDAGFIRGPRDVQGKCPPMASAGSDCIAYESSGGSSRSRTGTEAGSTSRKCTASRQDCPSAWPAIFINPVNGDRLDSVRMFLTFGGL